MRIFLVATAVAVVSLASSAAGQTTAPKGYTGAYGPDDANRPFGGPVPNIYPGPGRDEVASDGVSTKVVKAAPCSATAHETDGSTTCIGIPGPVPRDTTTIGEGR
jgi:hypothetical protein